MLKETELNIFQNFHSAMWIFDSLNNKIHWANNEAIAFWRKKDHRELYQVNFAIDQTEVDRAVIKEDLEEYKQGKERSQWCSFTPSDIAKEVYCHFSGIELNDGRIETLVQIIVSKVSLDSELSVHTTSTLVSLWDISGKLTSSNRLFTTYNGEMLNKFDDLFSHQKQADALWNQVLTDGQAERELCLQTLDGNRWYQLNLVLNKKGHTQYVTLRQFDITARKHRELHHQKLATTDQLTQIHNRFGVTQIIEKTINNRTPFTLFLIDLDKFKNINDYYGHEKGDALLKAVAFRLQRIFINALAISRLGGDEFLLLMPAKGAQNQKEEGSRLTRCLNTPYHISGLGNVQSGASIGVVNYPADADSMSELLLLADTAMYCSKTSRFDGCSFFDPEMAQPLLKRQKIRNSLKETIDNSGFLYHYEPILMIDDRTIAYSEIQTCWLHPELGMLNSNEFYPIADELSVMHDIELLTLMQACKQIYKDNSQLPILIKVSINELLSGRTYKNLETLSLQISSIPFKLQIAVMEEDIASREMAVAKQLEQIAAMKVTIVLDNFSVGGMSLTKLSKLPIDIIRFHEQFTQTLNSQSLSGESNDFIAYLLTCAKHAKYRVICKEVNNLDTVMRLTALGCDFVQDLPIHLINNSNLEKAKAT